jgi:hypothetical protein
MKRSSKAVQLLTGTIIALIVLAATIIAAHTKTSTTASLRATEAHTVASDQHSYDTLDTLHNNSIFKEDHFALRSDHFSMPQPTLYAIATLTGYGPAIRRARIRRKGNLHG